jgi:hypothetical protein
LLDVQHQRDLVLWLIALFKLIKALILIAIGVGALSLRSHRDGVRRLGRERHWPFRR